MEVLGKSKYLLTVLGLCLSKQEGTWLKLASLSAVVLLAIFGTYVGIVLSLAFILENIKQVPLVLQALYQIIGNITILGILITFAFRKYLIYEVFADLKRIVIGSKKKIDLKFLF